MLLYLNAVKSGNKTTFAHNFWNAIFGGTLVITIWARFVVTDKIFIPEATKQRLPQCSIHAFN
jgi:hypothetical protein